LREFEDCWLNPEFGRGGIKIAHFEGFLVDYAAKMKCQFIIRGIRNADDAKAELAYHEINKQWYPDIQTIFLPAIKYPKISSSVIKEIASFGGLERVKEYVPGSVYDFLSRQCSVYDFLSRQ
jgi:pantetheine-phosphate adenylyltransferase